MVMHRQVGAQASLVGSDGRFVFAMGADGDFGFSEDSLEGFLFVDEQIPGARSDEDLDAGDACRDFEGFDIGRRCAHVEAVVDKRLRRCDRVFLFDELLMDRGGFRVGHFQKARHTTSSTSATCSPKVFFMGQSWIAKMDLVVDQSGKQNQTVSVDNLVGRGRRSRVDRGDLSVE